MWKVKFLAPAWTKDIEDFLSAGLIDTWKSYCLDVLEEMWIIKRHNMTYYRGRWLISSKDIFGKVCVNWNDLVLRIKKKNWNLE